MHLNGWALTTDTAPANEPVTSTEAKNHARIDISDDDSIIDSLIETCREQVEDFVGRALVTQTLVLTLDQFPEVIRVPRPPLQSVTSIQYVDSDGVTQTLASSKYRVDTKSEPGRITPAYGEVWPVTRYVTGAVTVTFKAGFGDNASDVPERYKQAILLMLGHLYENREDVVFGAPVEMPQNSKWLLWPKRVKWFQ